MLGNRGPWSWQESSKDIQGVMEAIDSYQKRLGSINEGRCYPWVRMNVAGIRCVIRTIYSPDLVLMPFPNVKIAVDVLETEKVTFTNKSIRKRVKPLFFSFMSSSNFRSKILLIS